MEQPIRTGDAGVRFTMILVATGQNWPNAISYTSFKPVVDRVYVYETRGMRDQGQALRSFIGSAVGTDRDHFCRDQDNSSSAFNRFIESFPPDENLLVNVSGGLKLFWLHIQKLIRRPMTMVIYREVTDNIWYILKEDGEQPLPQLTIAESVSRDSIESLLQLQLCRPDVTISTAEPSTDDTFESIISTMTSARYLYANDLERFVEIALKLVGMKTWRQVKVTHNDQSLLEEDVFAVHKARPFIFECKVKRGADSAVRVLRKLHSSARELGGLNARSFLVAPLWQLSDEEWALARSLRVEIIGPKQILGQEAMPDGLGGGFFRFVARLAGTTDEHTIERVEALDSLFIELISRSTGTDESVFDMRPAITRLLEKCNFVYVQFPGRNFIVDKNGHVHDCGVLKCRAKEIATLRLNNSMPTMILLPRNYIVVASSENASNEIEWTKGKTTKTKYGELVDLFTTDQARACMSRFVIDDCAEPT